MLRRFMLAISLGLPLLGTLPVSAPGFAEEGKTAHRLAIHITQNDPGVMNMALLNAKNAVDYFQSKGEPIVIEFVAYGPGIHMLRSDTSPVKDRLKEMSQAYKNIIFVGCGNTMALMGKNEGKEITLVPEASVVKAGIGRLVELEERGYSYVKP